MKSLALSLIRSLVFSSKRTHHLNLKPKSKIWTQAFRDECILQPGR